MAKKILVDDVLGELMQSIVRIRLWFADYLCLMGIVPCSHLAALRNHLAITISTLERSRRVFIVNTLHFTLGIKSIGVEDIIHAANRLSLFQNCQPRHVIKTKGLRHHTQILYRS